MGGFQILCWKVGTFETKKLTTIDLDGTSMMKMRPSQCMIVLYVKDRTDATIDFGQNRV